MTDLEPITPVEGTVVPPEVDDLDAAYAEQARAAYRFRYAGREWQLPHLGELDYRLQAEIETFGETSLDLPKLESLFARMFGPEQTEAWAGTVVPGAFLFMLFDRWVTYSGGKLGEDQASTPSSGSTGVKSRPTSAASTASASAKRSTAKRAPRKVASRPVKSST